MLGSESEAAGLAGAIDALLALDPDAFDDSELADVVVELHRQQSRLAAATTRLTAALDARGVWADDGSRSLGRGWPAGPGCRSARRGARCGWVAGCGPCPRPARPSPPETSPPATPRYWVR